MADFTESNGKERLRGALFSLLDEKPLSKVTVGDICERAGVSRQTFYRHYESKFEIAKEYLYAIAERSMYRVGRDMSWHDSFMSVIDMALENGNELMSNDEVRSIAYRCRVETLEKTVTEHLGLELTDSLAFQIRFFAYSEANLLSGTPLLSANAMSQDCTPDELANLLEKCVPQELHDLLDV